MIKQLINGKWVTWGEKDTKEWIDKFVNKWVERFNCSWCQYREIDFQRNKKLIREMLEELKK